MAAEKPDDDQRLLASVGRVQRRAEVSIAEARSVGRMHRAVRKAERQAGDGAIIGGTGQTVIKLSATPMQRLLDKGKIGAEELRAAQEIETASMAIAGALWIKPQCLEKRDKGHGDYESAAVVDAVRRYRAFATAWSALAKRGHPLLEIVYAAVVDQRPFHLIAQDCSIRRSRAEATTIAGLRDYAARAGWVARMTGDRWMGDALGIFRLRDLTPGQKSGLIPVT